jgi:hypothetical protein
MEPVERATRKRGVEGLTKSDGLRRREEEIGRRFLVRVHR